MLAVRRVRGLGAPLGLALLFAGVARGQDDETPRPAAPAAAQTVNIKREALNLTDPNTFHIPFRTAAVKQVVLTAPREGLVSQVLAKLGQKVSGQAELVRLDDAREQLVLERAKALVAAAKVEVKLAAGKEDPEALAQARLEAAQAEFKLAEFDLQRFHVRAPFPGEVIKVHVVPGQLVRAGDPLATVADASALLVSVPVDRSVAKVGDEVDIQIEETAVKGKLTALLPPEEQFEPLRTLIHSMATGVLQIENPSGKHFVGQTVFSKALPKHPYAAVPTTAVENLADGGRKVQVIRQGVVRDVKVEPLSQQGTERIFVAGTFTQGDEIILSKSQPLKDGDQVRPPNVAAGAARNNPSGAATAAPGAF